MKNKRTYSAKEKNAYYMGVGAGVGFGKKIKTFAGKMTADEKRSFYNGLNDYLTKKKK